MNPDPSLRTARLPRRARFSRQDGGQPLILELGRTTIGRGVKSDLILEHPTVSDPHCAIEVTEDAVWVEDLHSTNGTLREGELVQRAALRPGQQLQLGEVQLTLEAEGGKTGRDQSGHESQYSLGAVPGSVCVNHPESRATWVCTRCGRVLCGACVQLVRVPAKGMAALCSSCQSLCERKGEAGAAAKAAMTFWGALLEALSFPVRGDGSFMLVGAVIVNTVIDLAGRWGMLQWVMAFVGFFVGAYLLLFFREVLLSSANGDSRIPAWPDFDRESLIEAVVQVLCTYVVSFGPWLLLRIWIHGETPSMLWLQSGALAFGIIYFPMALLAVVLLDSVAALNPIVVIRSIAKVPVRYAAVCGTLAIGIAGVVGLERLVTALPVPVIGGALAGFAWLYLMVFAMRLLGWLYVCSREKLCWC